MGYQLCPSCRDEAPTQLILLLLVFVVAVVVIEVCAIPSFSREITRCDVRLFYVGDDNSELFLVVMESHFAVVGAAQL